MIFKYIIYKLYLQQLDCIDLLYNMYLSDMAFYYLLSGRTIAMWRLNDSLVASLSYKKARKQGQVIVAIGVVHWKSCKSSFMYLHDPLNLHARSVYVIIGMLKIVAIKINYVLLHTEKSGDPRMSDIPTMFFFSK